MWLLSTESFKLTYVHHSRAKKYAILSHTWTNEEVSFQEWQQDTCKHKSGYEKILATCKRARDDGYDWAWVDTCCINKDSSAELTEAINSMWTWYCDAQICYVYLEDLSASRTPGTMSSAKVNGSLVAGRSRN